jgi:chemotaxis signal transduction protein
MRVYSCAFVAHFQSFGLAHTSAGLADKHYVTAPYLTFRVGRQELAIDASRVRGVLPAHDMIPIEVPDSHVCGFACTLGHEFPVIDLQRRLQIPAGLTGRLPCIVVIEGSGLLGFLADHVSEVITLREQEIRDGVVRRNGRKRHILDPDAIATEAELMELWRPIP